MKRTDQNLWERPLAMGIAVAAIVFAALAGTGFTVSLIGRQNLLEATRSELIGVARSAALFVSAREQNLVLAHPDDKAQYEEAIAGLRRFHGEHRELAYVYTLVKGRDGKVKFVLDTAQAGDLDGDGVEDKSEPGDACDETTPEMVEALATGVAAAEEQVQTDAWGTFISAYAPIQDSKGKTVGVVGVDMSAQKLLAKMQEIEQAGSAALFLGALLGALAGLSTFVLSAHSRSARMRMEASLVQLQEDVERLEGMLEGRDRLIAEGARSKRVFIEQISEDLLDPISRFNRALDTWRTSAQTQNVPLPADAALAAHDIRERVEEAREFAYLDSGKLRLEISVVSLAKELTSAVSAVQGENPDEPRVDLILHEDLPGSASMPSQRFRQLVVCALQSILEATEATVTFEAAPHSGGTRLWMKISAKQFEWYEGLRGSPVNEVKAALAQRLAPLMGGTIAPVLEKSEIGWEILLPLAAASPRAA